MGNPRAGRSGSSMALSIAQLLVVFLCYHFSANIVRSSLSELLLAPRQLSAHEQLKERRTKGNIFSFMSLFMSNEQRPRGTPLNFSPHAHAGTRLHDSHSKGYGCWKEGEQNQNPIGVMPNFTCQLGAVIIPILKHSPGYCYEGIL